MDIQADLAQKEIHNLLRLHDSNPEEAVAVYEAVREFAQKEIRPYDDGFKGQPDADTANHFPHHLWQKMGEQDLLGITVPVEYGGSAQGYLRHALITEQVSRASGSIGLSYIAYSNLCMNQIALNGTEEQKKRYLPLLASGDYVGALAMSEADAGSDVMSMKTTATKCDGGYLLNGSKLWITNGARMVNGNAVTADALVVYARTDEKKTAFILEGGTEGFKPGFHINKEGMRGSETWELQFDDCFIPDGNVLGTPGKGAHVLMKGLNYERLMLAAGAAGLAQAALDEALQYVVDRKQFGKAIGHNQVKAHQLADCQSQISAIRAQIYSYAHMADKEIPLTNSMAASAFLNASVMAKNVGRTCMEAMGGNGYTKDFRIGRLVRDIQLYATGGGTEDVRRDIIAREIIPGYAEQVQKDQYLANLFANASAKDIQEVIALGKQALTNQQASSVEAADLDHS